MTETSDQVTIDMSVPWLSFLLLTQVSMAAIWTGLKGNKSKKELKVMLLGAVSKSNSGHGNTMLTWDKDQVYIVRF